MRHIYKYPFAINDTVEIKMPRGAQVLSIQYQGDVPTIWAMVDAESKITETREFYVFGTGHDIPDTTDPLRYLATIQDTVNGLVWHVFE